MPAATTQSTTRRTLRIDTAWGDVGLVLQGEDVVRVLPPVTGSVVDADLDPADAPRVIRDLVAAMEVYFAGEPVELAERTDVERWLRAAGVSGFRLDLSLALFDVPRGVTLAYGELAALAGRAGAARAAGTTCARNPLPILIPCHRVVHAGARNGNVGSYGAATGTAYKRQLLQLEDAPLVRDARPTRGQ
jgi:methylated-DNA-[protein]-cysteine S-methyltransferase